MKHTHCRSLAGLVLLVLLVAGCGGSSSSGPKLAPGVGLLIGANVGVLPTQASTRAVALGAKLDAGATVEVFNFATGQKLASGVIGADGFTTVIVTPGLTVVAVITGTRDGKPYRLSCLIPSVPNGDAQYVADPVSTLTAEAIASKHFRTSLIDQDTLDTVNAASTQYLTDHPDADLSLGGGLLAAGAFGANTVRADALAPVIDAVPATIDNNLVRGKNAMHQFAEAGFPLGALTAGSSADYAPMGATIKDSAKLSLLTLEQLLMSVAALPSGVMEVLYPAISGQWAYVDANGDPVMNLLGNPASSKLFTLPIGKGFRYADGAFTADPSLNTAGQITMEGNTWGNLGEFRLTAKLVNSGTLWQVRVTDQFSDLYVLEVPMAALSLLGANPSLQAKLTYSNELDPAGTIKIFNGTFRAVGTNPQHYTSVTFSGTMTDITKMTVSDALNHSAELAAVLADMIFGYAQGELGGGLMMAAPSRQVEDEPVVDKIFTLSGTVTASFPAAVPAGAAADQTTYDFPTSAAVTNLSAKMQLGPTYESVMAGTAAVSFTTIQAGGTVKSKPIDIRTTGEFSSRVPSGTLSMTNSNTVKMTVLNAGTNPTIVPVNLILDDGHIRVTAGEDEISTSGKLLIDGAVVTKNGMQQVIYTHARREGSFTNTISEVSFTGALDATWLPTTTELPVVSATLTGTLTREGYQAYNVNVTYSLDGRQTQTITINDFAFGHFAWHGIIVTTLNSTGNDLEVTKTTVTLTNRENVTLKLTMEPQQDPAWSGMLTSGNTPVGTLEMTELGPVLNYTDGTHLRLGLDFALLVIGM